VLAQGAAIGLAPLFGPFPFACAESHCDLRFSAMWQGSSIGEHRVAFRIDGDCLTVETHIDMTARFLFFTVFRLKHDAREVWQSGRLVSVTSRTEHDDVHMEISGRAAQDGFRIVGQDGPFLANANLLTSNSLWNNRIVGETRLIDVQHGGEVGLIARPLGSELVATPQGSVPASRYQMITPYYAGSTFYDADQRWVKALVEMKGETIEYVLAP
jgi:hypothetical protein